ncbi:T9SS type A sorting domain-containing protein [Crocinitomicaceae bacterium]|nr:T9SS type A sorting domain-containing protein [Crocinitomicaceae bacterium]
MHTDGDATWMYNWSDGQNGIGLNSAILTPNSAEPVLTIIAITPLGCEHSETLWLNIHSQDNQAPWMDGTWGSGNYTTYVNQGDIAYIYSSLYNDHSNEEISYEISDNLPSNYQLINLPPPSPPTDGGPFMIEWQTNSNTPPGSYFINLHSEDNNACESLPSDHTFHIQVICDHCPKCIYYNEVSTPGNNPLPPETKAGRCIVAGYTAPVETGNEDVLFQAGQYIQLGSKFSAGTGFQANIDETTCIDDCEDCCDDWTGFTYDPIQNFVYFWDGNPETDIWQMTDINHPFCAFNATGYTLDIMNNAGGTIHSSHSTTTDCCPFDSPGPGNNIAHSEIWWNGYTNNIFGNMVHPLDGVYFYYVTLYGCNGAEIEIHGNITVQNTGGMITNPNLETPRDELSQEHYENLDLNQIQELEEKITLFPNPANESLTIQGIPMPVMVNILDTKGKTLLHEESSMGQIDLLNLAGGVYFVQIYIGNRSIMKEFIKQ